MQYDNPRYADTHEKTTKWIETEFTIESTRLFTTYNAPTLKLYDSPERACPECGEEVHQTNNTWQCMSCDATSTNNTTEYDKLKLREATLGYPGTYGNSFITSNNNIKQHAAKCGFYVYELNSNQTLLAIDGAGYDFMQAHWIPLYLATTQE